MFHCTFDEVKRIADVIGEIQEWLFHRLTNERIRCEVHDAIGVMCGEGGVNGSAILQVTEDEFSVGMDSGAMSLLVASGMW